MRLQDAREAARFHAKEFGEGCSIKGLIILHCSGDIGRSLRAQKSDSDFFFEGPECDPFPLGRSCPTGPFRHASMKPSGR